MSIETFDIEKFQTLSGNALDEYSSRMVAQGRESFQSSDYERLASMLSTADEYHALYILELCAKLDECRIAPVVASYLSSGIASLCCAAARILGSMETSSMTDEIRATIESCPVVELYWDDPTSGISQQVGTNELFTKELREKHGIRSETAGK